MTLEAARSPEQAQVEEWESGSPFTLPRGEASPETLRAWSEGPSESPFTDVIGAEASWTEGPFGEGQDWSPELEDEGFPSGLVLQPASGATGAGQEHWDPTGANLPLLATGPSTHRLRLSTNFTVGELVTSGGMKANVARIDPPLVRLLQGIRDLAGRPVTVRSGYRSWARNVAVYKAGSKEATKSQHCAGRAADISIRGLNGMQIAKLAIDAWGSEVAVGIGWTYGHVDVRGRWARWTYLGGAADAAAKAEIDAYRIAARVRRGSLPVPRPNAPASTAAATGRLEVRNHPMLTTHRGTQPDLILRWNAMTAPSEIDVVIHLHGFGAKHGRDRLLLRDKERDSGLDFSDPSGSGAPGRSRPTLGVIPRGHYHDDADEFRYWFPALVKPGAMRRLAQDALARFTAQTGVAAPMGRLILTAHSGGGAWLIKAVKDADPDEVHVFDALYQDATPIGDWAQGRISREVGSPASIPPALRVQYIRGTGTATESEKLGKRLCALLAAPGAARLAARFRVESTPPKVIHGQIPPKYGWALLADAAAVLPGVTAVPCVGGPASKTEWLDETLEGDSIDEGMDEEEEAEDEESESLDWAEWSETPTMESASAIGLEAEDESGEDPYGEGLDPLETGQSVEDLAAAEGLEPESDVWETGKEGPWGESEATMPGSAGGWSSQASEAGVLSLDGPAQGFELDEFLTFEAGDGSSLADRIRAVVALAAGPMLRRGSKGPAVAALQRMLVALGHDLVIDGDFGSNTDRAIRALQSRQGISADGVVGPQTKSALATALGRSRQGSGPAPSPAAAPVSTPLCAAAARIAEEEYRRWHPASGAFQETDLVATPILQRYYREGVGTAVSAADVQSAAWQQAHPWSAVFVSWVMRTAGASASFTYSQLHQDYIRAARRNRLDRNTANPFWGYRVTEVAPAVGDLVCRARDGSGATYENIGEPRRRSAHCDIVTEVRPSTIRAIGGNAQQNVDSKDLRTLADGRLVLDGRQAEYFAVVRCRGRATPGLDARILRVMELLVDSYSYQVNAAAGIVGNLMAESDVLPDRVEGSRAETPMRAPDFTGRMVDFTPDQVMNRDTVNQTGPRRPGIGIAQWTAPDRRRGLFQHVFQGRPPGSAILDDLEAQVDYLVAELRARPVNGVLTTAGVSLEDAADEVVYRFEVPAAVLDGKSLRPRTDPAVVAVFEARRARARRAFAVYRAAHP